jgi:hypothetical protein
MDDYIEDDPLIIDSGDNHEQALKDLQDFAKKYPVLSKRVRNITADEMGSVLFFANGDDIVIQGMHYPDDALDPTVIPNIFPGSEKNTFIAGFPNSLIEQMAEIVKTKVSEEYQEAMWQKMMGTLLESVVEMLDGNEPPTFNPEDLL